MSQESEENVSSWNRDQVKYWLELKGINNEIQNRFYNEAIDGEALLYLREQDINELCPSSTKFGIRRKLATYIGNLQSVNININNNPFNKIPIINPLLNNIIHTQHSLSPQKSSFIFNNNMSAPFNTSSLSPTHINRNLLSHFNQNSHSPDAHLLNLPSSSPQTRPLSMNTNPIPFSIAIPNDHNVNTMDYNQSHSLSTFDQYSHCESDLIAKDNDNGNENVNGNTTAMEMDIDIEHNQQKLDNPSLRNELNVISNIQSTSINNNNINISPRSDHPSITHNEQTSYPDNNNNTHSSPQIIHHHNQSLNTQNINVSPPTEIENVEEKTQRSSIKLEPPIMFQPPIQQNINFEPYSNEHKTNASHDEIENKTNSIQIKQELLQISTRNDIISESEQHEQIGIESAQDQISTTYTNAVINDQNPVDHLQNLLYDDNTRSPNTKLKTGKYAIQSSMDHNNPIMEQMKLKLLAQKKQSQNQNQQQQISNNTEIEMEAMKARILKQRQAQNQNQHQNEANSKLSPPRKRKRRTIEDDESDDSDSNQNNDNRPLRKRARTKSTSPCKRMRVGNDMNGNNQSQPSLNDTVNSRPHPPSRPRLRKQRYPDTPKPISPYKIPKKQMHVHGSCILRGNDNTNANGIKIVSKCDSDNNMEIDNGWSESDCDNDSEDEMIISAKTKKESANVNERKVKVKRKRRRKPRKFRGKGEDNKDGNTVKKVKDIRNKINSSTKEPYRYSKDNTHDTSNQGKRWTAKELEMIWYFHYSCHWNNLQIAEKFKRTDCGIMVQLDKMYKDKRDKEDLVNKKYLYQQNVDRVLKGENEVIKPERKWSEKLHKWIDVKVSKDEQDNNNHHKDRKISKRFFDSDDSDDESESDSDSDDDIPIGLRMTQSKMKNEVNK